MKGFKVFWVEGRRKVERTFTICRSDLVISTKMKDEEAVLEIVEVKPSPVWSFRKVVGKREKFGFSSYAGEPCRKKRGIFIDGERIDGEILPRKSLIEDFLNGGSVLVVSIDKWISIYDFPGREIRRIPLDELMLFSLGVLGKREILRILKEVIL